LNEEEQQAVEEALLADDELFDLLALAEDELTDEYVEGALSSTERERFENLFLPARERQRKLSFAMALRRYVTAEAGASTEAAPAETTPQSATSEAQGAGKDARAIRARVLEHPTRRAVFPSVWWKRAFANPYLRMAATAVIVLSLGLGIWRV